MDNNYTRLESTAGSRVERRRFIKAAASAGLALPCTGPVAHALGIASSVSAQPYWELQAARVVQTFGDGSSLPFFRYRALGSTPSAGTVPLLSGRAGEVARLRVHNTLSRAIRPTVVGGTSGPLIAPGEDLTYELPLPAMGTWLLTDAELGDAAGPMGLGAVVISRIGATPGRRTLQTARPRYDRDYVLLYVDADDRWNVAIDNDQSPDYGYYEPNYHTVNGLTFPDTTTDAGTLISCRVGERVLLRLCNLGWVRQAVHFHGYHANIERINNQPQTAYGPKDTIAVPGHGTVEVTLPVTQPGLFPLHPHSLTTTTDNGLYAGGQITLIDAS